MTTVLTNPHRYLCMLIHRLILFGPEDFNDKGKAGEEEPLDGAPPPADTYPPQNAFMLGFKNDIGLVDDLSDNVLATAGWTLHQKHPPY